MPIAVVPARRITGVAVAGVGVWAVLAATVLRPQPLDLANPANVASPRDFMIVLSGNPHPVTTDDYASVLLRETVIRGPGIYQDTERLEGPAGPLRPEPSGPSVVIVDYAVGLSSYSQPTDVYVLDALGLGDAFTSHLQLEGRGRAGHEKVLPAAWIWARFVDEADAPMPDVIAVPDILVRGAGTDIGPQSPDDFGDDVEAAREAWSCAPIRRLEAATTDPLTAGRMLRNIGDSLRLHVLRIPSNPQDAVRELC